MDISLELCEICDEAKRVYHYYGKAMCEKCKEDECLDDDIISMEINIKKNVDVFQVKYEYGICYADIIEIYEEEKEEEKNMRSLMSIRYFADTLKHKIQKKLNQLWKKCRA